MLLAVVRCRVSEPGSRGDYSLDRHHSAARLKFSRVPIPGDPFLSLEPVVGLEPTT